jgi:hypothetical protein
MPDYAARVVKVARERSLKEAIRYARNLVLRISGIGGRDED